MASLEIVSTLEPRSRTAVRRLPSCVRSTSSATLPLQSRASLASPLRQNELLHGTMQLLINHRQNIRRHRHRPRTTSRRAMSGSLSSRITALISKSSSQIMKSWPSALSPPSDNDEIDKCWHQKLKSTVTLPAYNFAWLSQ